MFQLSKPTSSDRRSLARPYLLNCLNSVTNWGPSINIVRLWGTTSSLPAFLLPFPPFFLYSFETRSPSVACFTLLRAVTSAFSHTQSPVSSHGGRTGWAKERGTLSLTWHSSCLWRQTLQPSHLFIVLLALLNNHERVPRALQGTLGSALPPDVPASKVYLHKKGVHG